MTQELKRHRRADWPEKPLERWCGDYFEAALRAAVEAAPDEEKYARP